VDGWGKVLAGVVIGVAGTVYATNEDLRKRLPETARDLPDNVRRRFDSAVSAAREASSRRREEILRDLQEHDAAHAGRATQVRISQEAGTAEPTADEVGPSPRASD
jgi:uncharacterized membrane protein YccC